MTAWAEMKGVEKARALRAALRQTPRASATDLFPRLGAPSRNAIIGVAHRHGIQLQGSCKIEEPLSEHVSTSLASIDYRALQLMADVKGKSLSACMREAVLAALDDWQKREAA